MVLTQLQRTELHSAILDYLRSQGLEKTAETFVGEANVPEPEKKIDGLLEKKWTSILRLQKKVQDLEKKVEEQQETMRAPIKLSGPKDIASWIPRPPARHDISGHRMAVTCVLFHPLYTILVTASEDATIKLYDYESGEFERTLKGHTNAVQDLAFSPDGTQLASCAADTTIKLWSLEGFECTKTLHGHDHNVSSVTFTPDGAFLVSSSRDKSIKIWELSSGYCLHTLMGHSDWVRKARVSNDGSLIVSVSHDQSVRVWSFQSHECKFVLRDHEHVVEYVAWAPKNAYPAITHLITGDPTAEVNPNAAYFATSSRDKSIKLFDAHSGQCIHTFIGHDNWVRCLVWHPGGRYLLSSADDRTIRVWDIAGKRQFKQLEAHEHFVSCIDMHPTAPVAASGSVDQTVRVWDCR